QWLEVVHGSFKANKDEANGSSSAPTTIAIHCVAGLGRAPVLVAVALIERGMDPLDAIEHVRNKRRGAFNNRQIAYLAESYKRSSGFKGANKIMMGSSIRSSPIGRNANVAADQPLAAPHEQQNQSANSTHMNIFKKMFFGSSSSH
ncbi:Protein tyrosine phosphatase type IVA 2, partial [Coemansia sp. RSA 1933]